MFQLEWLPELATERENALPANPVRTLAFWRSRHRKRFQVYLPHRPFELGDAPVSHAAVLLERAIEYRRILKEDPSLTHALIASEEGICRSRVTQILGLLRLPQDVKDTLLHGVDSQDTTESQLRRMLRNSAPMKQFQELCSS